MLMGYYDIAEIIENAKPKRVNNFIQKIFGKYKKDSVDFKTPQEIRNLTKSLDLDKEEERIQ